MKTNIAFRPGSQSAIQAPRDDKTFQPRETTSSSRVGMTVRSGGSVAIKPGELGKVNGPSMLDDVPFAKPIFNPFVDQPALAQALPQVAPGAHSTLSPSGGAVSPGDRLEAASDMLRNATQLDRHAVTLAARQAYEQYKDDEGEPKMLSPLPMPLFLTESRQAEKWNSLFSRESKNASTEYPASLGRPLEDIPE